jgi:hypothetical protein
MLFRERATVYSENHTKHITHHHLEFYFAKFMWRNKCNDKDTSDAILETIKQHCEIRGFQSSVYED